jgi:glycosyltransferase involved in cell wall biosynthesis
MNISVIMLTYNREALIGRAIESILSQTFEDFEFIIVDNGSTDRSGAIADGYAEKDGRIRVIHRERGNIGSGRNTGLDAATGEYILFVDDDDWAEPDFLEFLTDLAVKNDADVAICGSWGNDEDEKIIMSPDEAIIELMWRKRYNMAFPTKIFHCSLAHKIRFPEEGQFDDIALMYKLLAFARRVAYHGLPKYTFCRHANNNSAWTSDHRLLTVEILTEYLEAYEKRTVWLSELFQDSKAAFEYFKWSFMISMVEKITRIGIQGCDEQLAYMKKELLLNRVQFMESSYILPFEKAWMDQYILLP